MAQDLNNVNIGLEQIVAALLATTGPVKVTFNTLLQDYSKKNISVTPDEDSDEILFDLVDAPKGQEDDV